MPVRTGRVHRVRLVVKKFIVLTFLLLGWGYYELSGGAAFVAEERPVDLAETPAAAPVTPAPETPDAVELGGIEIVTRADTPTLVSLTEPAEDAATLAAADITAALEAANDPAPTATSAPVADLREVAGERVNLREGPGRDFTAIDQLGGGTVVEVLATGEAGWVQIEVVSTGQTGWMSADFLTPIPG
jgi:hypothetical protein